MNIIQAKQLSVIDVKLNYIFQHIKDMRGKNGKNPNII